MNESVWLDGKRVRLDPRRAVGSGGEADVYNLGDGRALKVYKRRDHPDFAGSASAQASAQARLTEIGAKLQAFPGGLPLRVVAPQSVAVDAARGGCAVGYAMRLLNNVEPLLLWGDRARERGTANEIAPLFQDLRTTLQSVHAAGVVIGDFNDLNVLVATSSKAAQREAWLIDADSFGFGAFPCRMFTARFVDPLLCDVTSDEFVLLKHHTTASDWYAYAAMLMRALLGVEPFGGLYKPKDPAHKVAHHLRSLRGVSVFHPDVRYPKPARPLQTLPDEWLHAFVQTFDLGARDPFPGAFLDDLRWTNCTICNREHARATCPFCAPVAATASVQATIVVRGTVTATRVLQTRGTILSAFDDGALRYLLHENGTLQREFGEIRHALAPNERVRMAGESTLIARNERAWLLRPNAATQQLGVDACANRPCCDLNRERVFWIRGEQLWRSTTFGVDYPQAIGQVLAGQTRFWVGANFGCGFYRVGNVCVGFVFETHQGGLNDEVKLPLRGELIDATCVFASERCWLLLAVQEKGRLWHRCFVVARNGVVIAQSDAEAGDGTWLGGPLRGKCALGEFLLAPTDDGVARVETGHGALIVAKTFPETSEWVRADSQLFATANGLGVANEHEIYQLALR